jgi:hypothetical protein
MGLRPKPPAFGLRAPCAFPAMLSAAISSENRSNVFPMSEPTFRFPRGRFAHVIAISTLSVASLACGGAQKSTGSAETAEPEKAEPAEPETSEPADPEAAPQEPAAPAASAEAAKPGEFQGWDILYRMTSGGLVAEVGGVKLKPKAKPVRSGGGWRVELTFATSTLDDRMHRLLSPEGGPLMMASKIEKDGATRELLDSRKGDEEMFVTSGEAIDIKRTYPPAAEKPVAKGESLTLQVGLWGLGADADERQPVRRLFVVKMVVGAGTPQAVITPPE